MSTAILAYLILGEKLDGVQTAGMAVVLAGVLLISTEGRKKTAGR